MAFWQNNNSIDSFVRPATLKHIKFEYFVHSTERHAFDALDDNDETRKIMKYISFCILLHPCL